MRKMDRPVRFPPTGSGYFIKAYRVRPNPHSTECNVPPKWIKDNPYVRPAGWDGDTFVLVNYWGEALLYNRHGYMTLIEPPSPSIKIYHLITNWPWHIPGETTIENLI